MKKLLIFIPLLCFYTVFSQDSFDLSYLENTYSNDYLGKMQLKKLENSFKKINEKLYMGETEVTIQQYNYFLNDLLAQRNYDALLNAKVEKTDWRSHLPKEYANLNDTQIFPNFNPDAEFCPVQNMTYEGAVAFCNWLTKWYQNEDFTKRKWKNVVFRLPTEKEWEQAAGGGKHNVKYPWGGNEYRNLKGCFLSNFNCINETCENCKSHAESKDGGFFPVKVDCYFPNDFALYCMSGNVAEMVTEKGIAKGGSWEDLPSECTIQAQKKYDKPSPAIGFRVIMEILN